MIPSGFPKRKMPGEILANKALRLYNSSIAGKKGGIRVEKSHKPVFINLLAIARYDHMPDYPIQFMTVGKLDYRSPGEALLEYVESQQDEATGEISASNISLSVRDGKVTMERRGDFSNTMVFSRGQRFEGVYHTPYGEMNMAVFTREAACRIGSENGSLHLKYQLNIQGNYASSNELHLEYHTDPAGSEKEKGKDAE